MCELCSLCNRKYHPYFCFSFEHNSKSADKHAHVFNNIPIILPVLIPLKMMHKTISFVILVLLSLILRYCLYIYPPVCLSVCLFVCLSVCLSVRMEQLGTHWADFHEIWYYGIFSRKSLEKIQVPLKLRRITDTVDADQYTFLSYLTQFFLERKLFQAKL